MYHSMHDSVFAEQNDLPRRTYEPLPIFSGSSVLIEVTKRKLLYCFVDCVWDSHEVVSGNSNGARFQKRVLQVIKEIVRVLDTDAQSD